MKKMNDPSQSTLKMPCQHKFKKGAAAYSNKTLSFRCTKCGELVDRPLTLPEIAERTILGNEQRKRTQFVHAPYHDFAARFKHANTHAFILQGFDLMEEVEEWAANWPTRVFITSVDDLSYTSSMLVFITGDEPDGTYWCTHVVVISQCDGVPPKEFFLYPGHAQEILGVLKLLNQRAKRRSVPSWPFKESTFEVKQPCSKKRSKSSGGGSTTSRRRSPKPSG